MFEVAQAGFERHFSDLALMARGASFAALALRHFAQNQLNDGIFGHGPGSHSQPALGSGETHRGRCAVWPAGAPSGAIFIIVLQRGPRVRGWLMQSPSIEEQAQLNLTEDLNGDQCELGCFSNHVIATARLSILAGPRLKS